MAETPTAERESLVHKIAEVCAHMSRLPQTGRHPQGWAYATEADIVDRLRPELAQRGVIIIPALMHHEEREIGKTSRGLCIQRHTVDVRYVVTDGTSEIVIDWRGQADDSSDKGFAKATTAAGKYLLMRLFMLSSGADADAHDTQPDEPVAESGWVSPRGQVAQAQAPQLQLITDAQRGLLWARAKEAGVSGETLHAIIWYTTRSVSSTSQVPRHLMEKVLQNIDNYNASAAGPRALAEHLERHPMPTGEVVDRRPASTEAGAINDTDAQPDPNDDIPF
jgi:ERF superfamily